MPAIHIPPKRRVKEPTYLAHLRRELAGRSATWLERATGMNPFAAVIALCGATILLALLLGPVGALVGLAFVVLFVASLVIPARRSVTELRRLAVRGSIATGTINFVRHDTEKTEGVTRVCWSFRPTTHQRRIEQTTPVIPHLCNSLSLHRGMYVAVVYDKNNPDNAMVPLLHGIEFVDTGGGGER